MSRAAAAGGFGAFKCFVHDLANGAGAAAALGAATQAAIDLAGGPWTLRRLTGGSNVLVGQYVAGTDDHGWISGPRMALSIPWGPVGGKRNRPILYVV